jgi:diguanylate cyclase (GGDEF)-like protein
MQAVARFAVPRSSGSFLAQNRGIAVQLSAAAIAGDQGKVRKLLSALLLCRARRADEKFQLQLEALEDMFHLMRSMAVNDELTGLYNRRGFVCAGVQLLELLTRDMHPALLLYLDVNGLKDVNDSLGHHAGDALLQQTARVLRNVFRSHDVIGRLGGDEFAALIPVTDPSGCEITVNRIREAVVARNRVASGPVLSLSIGVAPFDPRKPLTVTRLLQLADRNMYREKRQTKLEASGEQVFEPRLAVGDERPRNQYPR